MISNNFNQLNNEIKNNIHKCLCNVFNKENIDFFIEKKINKIYQQETEDFNLTKNFSIKKWDIFQKIFNFGSFSEEKITKLKNILTDLEFINNKISIFNKIDEMFNFDMAIAGGALRDFLLMENPNVKDLDLIMSFKYKKNLLENYFNSTYNRIGKDKIFFNESLIKSSENLKKNGFKDLDIEKINQLESLDDKIKEYLVQVVNIILSKELKIIAYFKSEFKNIVKLKNLISNSGYTDKHLSGVIKIKDIKLNYDVDILITSVQIESYLDAFDYSICKIMSIITRDNNFLVDKNNLLGFLKTITLNEEIYEDLSSNHITFNIDNFTKAEVESSIINHYPRIKEKYPKLNLILKGDKNRDLIDSLNLYLKLNQKLINNNVIKKKNKI